MQFLTSLDFWLWAAAGLLAVVYLAAGSMKATRPIPALAATMKWPADVAPGLVRFVGVSEVLGAIGILLPLATNILAWLSPVAAICLALVQALAIGFHIIRKEPQVVPFNVVLLLLAVFVAWGRGALLGL